MGIEVQSRWKAARREEAVMVSGESGAERNDSKKWSRSATASRKIKELARSGGLVIDETKRMRFEKKCTEIDSGAEFRYQDTSWQVYMAFEMSEVVQDVGAVQHHKVQASSWDLQGERRKAEFGNYELFRPSNPSGITSTSAIIKHSYANKKITAQTQFCHGISDIHNPLISTYISWTIVEGAGSISLQKAAKIVYSDNITYPKLSVDQKATVAITQYHLWSWSINHELQVVFSTNCTKFFVKQNQSPKMICSNCENLLQLNEFKRALRVKPAPLERMKYTPIKFRGPLEDLGPKFAGIRGLSELLQDVRTFFNCLLISTSLQLTSNRIHKPLYGCDLLVVLSKASMMITLSSSQ